MKIFEGKVTAKKMDKTATVVVRRMVAHPIYKKRQVKSKKYQVHDEVGVGVGDKVSFIACRPISKLKRWKILEMKGKGKK